MWQCPFVIVWCGDASANSRYTASLVRETI